MLGHLRNSRHAISTLRSRCQLRTQEEDDEATAPPGLAFQPVATDSPVGGDGNPASLGRERIDPRAILGIGRQTVGQAHGLIAFGFKLRVERVGEIGREIVVEKDVQLALDRDRIGEERCRDAARADDWLPEAAGRVDNDRILPARRPLAHRHLAIGKPDSGIKARADDAGESELALHCVEKLRFASLIDNLGKDRAAVSAEPLRRKGMVDAVKLSGSLGAQRDHAPRDGGLTELFNEPRFHQIQEPKTERTVDLGKLT